MREIKFRAYEPVSKRMFEVDGLSFRNQYVTDEGGQHTWKFNQVVLMQFTGLLDKQGKEIYEGDIVRGKNGWQETVLLDNYGLMLYLKEISNNLKVIGNIWENPELKEGK